MADIIMFLVWRLNNLNSLRDLLLFFAPALLVERQLYWCGVCSASAKSCFGNILHFPLSVRSIFFSRSAHIFLLHIYMLLQRLLGLDFAKV